MKIVIIDSGKLPTDVEFPPIDFPKYGWEQYPALQGDDIAERCWRADIVITLATAINKNVLEKMNKLRLLICAGAACDKVNQSYARDKGVELLAFPAGRYDTVSAAQDLCNRISLAIDHFIKINQDDGETF